MSGDALVRGLLPGDVKVAVVVCTQAARHAAKVHGLRIVSAALLAQGFSGALLLASVQKGDSRVNLQVECDGPLRGLFVDAGADGTVRGYVKNPHVDVQSAPGPYRWRPALGNSGFLSVLRDVGAEYYRSSVALTHLDLSRDLAHYFATSDQVPTRLALAVVPDGAQGLGVAAGVLLQVLPDADLAHLEALGATLEARLQEALAQAPGDAQALLARLFPQLDVEAVEEAQVRFACSCSKARVLDALAATGRAHLEELIAEGKPTTLTCQFCAAQHVVEVDELRALLAKASGPPPAQA